MSPRARLATILVPLVLVLAALTVWIALKPRDEVGSNGGAATDTPVPLDALGEAAGWLNGGPGVVDSLRGGPVLLVVWSDTDPVSLELLPQAQTWLDAYGRYGLHVVGVHEPEYAFAAEPPVPARAVQRLGLRFPVALDPGMRVSQRLGAGDVRPLWLLADAGGRQALRAEGDRAEQVQAALRALIRRTHPESGLPEEPAPESEPSTVRRVYCGVSRVGGGPLSGSAPGRTQIYTAQFRYEEEGNPYTPYPVGRWTPTAEGVMSARGGASDFLAVRYPRGAASAVIGAADGATHRVWVLCDEAWMPDSLRGEDVESDTRGGTYVDVAEPRVYSVVRGGGAHVLKLSPEQPGVTVYEWVFRAP